MHSQTRSTSDQPFTKITVAAALTLILITRHHMQRHRARQVTELK